MDARVKPAHDELTTAQYGMRTSARGCAGLNVGPPERRLHLAPHFHGKIVFVIGDVAPAQAITLREVALEPDPMRKPSGSKPCASERAAGTCLPQTQNPP